MKTAPSLVLWFLKLAGALAVTMPWKTVYCRPGQELNYALAAHEAVHVAQIERDGAIKWTAKIFWYLLRYGYVNSPYEVEARAKAGY
jgi:hypothetical protein